MRVEGCFDDLFVGGGETFEVGAFETGAEGVGRSSWWLEGVDGNRRGSGVWHDG